MIEDYLCQLTHCTKEELQSNHVILKTVEQENYIKVIAYKNVTVVLASKNYALKISSLIQNKNRDQIFELPYVYGQTLHYVYDASRVKKLSLNPNFQFEMIEKDFKDVLHFTHAVDQHTKYVVVAKKGAEIVAVVGASVILPNIYEVGVDVLEKYRHQGLASQLVYYLSEKLMADGILPIYSASTTNIASQMVASNSGYKLCWVDTFGTINDAYDAYKNTR